MNRNGFVAQVTLIGRRDSLPSILNFCQGKILFLYEGKHWEQYRNIEI